MIEVKTVVFLDSGVGGLPYLAEVQKRRPNWRLAYVADNASFPYGDKKPEQLRAAVEAVAAAAVERIKPDALVLACNTASVTALAHVRSRLHLPVIGVVPAVKPAAGQSEAGRIGVLATSRTVADAYLDRLIQDFASECVVTRVAAGDIVRFVEIELPHASRLLVEGALRPGVDALLQADVDTVVLGCTHFLHLRHELEHMFGPDIRVIDSRDGVASRVIAVLEKTDGRTAGARPTKPALGPASGLASRIDARGNRLFVTKHHGADAPIVWFATRFGLEPAGLLYGG